MQTIDLPLGQITQRKKTKIKWKMSSIKIQQNLPHAQRYLFWPCKGVQYISAGHRPIRVKKCILHGAYSNALNDGHSNTQKQFKKHGWFLYFLFFHPFQHPEPRAPCPNTIYSTKQPTGTICFSPETYNVTKRLLSAPTDMFKTTNSRYLICAFYTIHSSKFFCIEYI